MSYRDRRTDPPFDPTRADRILAGLFVLLLAGLIVYVILNGAGLV